MVAFSILSITQNGTSLLCNIKYLMSIIEQIFRLRKLYQEKKLTINMETNTKFIF
jgi:hypothetical protein